MTRLVPLTLAIALLLPLAYAAAPADDAAWVRVQFDGRIAEVDRAALEATGADGIQYVPHDAYVAYAAADAAQAAAEIDGVREVRPVTADEKLHPDLVDRAGAVTVSVHAHPGADLSVAGSLLGRYRAQPSRAVETQRVTTDAGGLAALARNPAVLAVSPAPTALVPEDEGTAQILAGNVALGEIPPPGYEDFLADIGLDGFGVTVSIVDTGIDPNHPELTGRIDEKIEYSPLPTGEPVDAYGHGTHVAGIVGGVGADIGPLGPATDAAGLQYGLGVAPGVRFVDQNAIALSAITNFPPSDGFIPLGQDAVRAGAVAWNASWTSGEGEGAGYVDSAREMDIITRDADPDEAGEQPLTLVFSAGNSGPDERTLTSPKEAKNIISVAASNSHRAGFTEGIAGFSSRGPAVDGRFLPVVAAPGASVASARSTASTIACSIPQSDGYGLYSLCSGTSMAAPHVTGSVALAHEWWREANDGDDPSPAMIKALLVNSARDMLVPDIPSVAEGWGRVDLRTLFDPAAERVYLDQTHVLDAVGDAFTVDVVPADPSQPLKATLVWTDPPAAANANPALVNDLDLTVTSAGGATWHGNVFRRGWSTAGGEPDRLNNVENVYLEQVDDAAYSIEVRAANLPDDGAPTAGDATDQDFALVLSNAVLASSGP